MLEQPAVAIARLEGIDTWRWDLKLDSIGLYRWYLNGDKWTSLRGADRAQADAALYRFVERALNGTLIITEAGVLAAHQ